MLNIIPKDCVIGSGSRLKLEGATAACQRHTFAARFHSVKAVSGIADQPVGLEQMEQGARNRITSAKALMPHQHLYFAAESGLVQVADRWYDVVCGAVHDARGPHVSVAFSAYFPIATWVVDLVFNMKSELGEVVKKLSGGRVEEKDALAYFTRHRLNRKEQVTQAFLYALPPILNSDLYEKGE